MNKEEQLPLKDKAMSFLKLVASGKVQEAYQNYVSADFRHHNPYFKGDADSLMNGMLESAAQNPNKIMDVKLAIQENDTVAVHSHVKQNHDDLGGAVVHIFRFEEGKIVELWDVGQAVPKDSPNRNGMF
ncbi:nuclear transport factor 2 family protein [Oceanobacillus piezotolerans]|uniref:Nuclear transport factor 2 family protein n=1 Tax=Oceanobacillus piezotolerans TaxID=2448030 RepID=A0A498D550_9BACI|nr:ester cyclase [Oceanobacillus piezotolerans]RLL43976.1 nuclear transport factor 2 family protein [Oceanobacillus piezotolerans]